MNGRVRISNKMQETMRHNKSSQKGRANFTCSKNSSFNRILFLQKTIGNQAVQRLIKSGALQAKLRMTKIPHAGFIGEVYDTPTLVPSAVDGGTATEASAKTGGGNCTDTCNRAYANSSLNYGGGGVICDGATKCPCVFDVPPLRRGQCPGFDAIVLRHEQQHLTDVDCNPSGGLHRPPFRDPSNATSSECMHRRQTIAEMNRIIPGASGICRTGMTSIRDQLNTWVTANCGSGGSSSSKS